MKQNIPLGILSSIGVWVTAGIALPMVNVLTMFTPGELLVARGFLTAALAMALARGNVMKVDRYTKWGAVVVAFASLGLFNGVRAWGAGPTIVIVTATPALNFLFTFIQGKRPSVAALGALVLLLGGVTLARWNGLFSWEGLLWSLLATIANGFLYELWGRAKDTAFQQCFWGSMGMGTIGLAFSLRADWSHTLTDPTLLARLLAFALVGGFLYWMANLLAFRFLPKDTASVLVQGEAIGVILVGGFLLGEDTSAIQWFGVALALTGACGLILWMLKQKST